MAYSEALAARVRKLLENEKGCVEKKMFGGICWLLHGNMACGIIRDELIVRVGPDNYHAALARPHTREFDVTGRPMNGWVTVAAAGLAEEQELSRWVEQGRNFARNLPEKSAAPR